MPPDPRRNFLFFFSHEQFQVLNCKKEKRQTITEWEWGRGQCLVCSWLLRISEAIVEICLNWLLKCYMCITYELSDIAGSSFNVVHHFSRRCFFLIWLRDHLEIQDQKETFRSLIVSGLFEEQWMEKQSQAKQKNQKNCIWMWHGTRQGDCMCVIFLF